jgi:hypothetical protein
LKSTNRTQFRVFSVRNADVGTYPSLILLRTPDVDDYSTFFKVQVLIVQLCNL